jgi:hypothetical protein
MEFSSRAAAGINISAFGGWTWVSMARENYYINAYYDTLASAYNLLGDPLLSTTKTNMGDALMAGLDVTYEAIPGLNIGPRFEYIGGIEPATSVDCESPGTGRSDTLSMGAALMPFMAGVSYLYAAEKLNFGAEVYAGYGLGSSYITTKSNGGLLVPGTFNSAGNCFVIESSLKFQYNSPNGVTMGLKLGYRQAKVDEMKAVAGVASLHISKGDPVRDQSLNIMPYDFSGGLVNVNIGKTF